VIAGTTSDNARGRQTGRVVSIGKTSTSAFSQKIPVFLWPANAEPAGGLRLRYSQGGTPLP
jgi:hypothetical protein